MKQFNVKVQVSASKFEVISVLALNMKEALGIASKHGIVIG